MRTKKKTVRTKAAEDNKNADLYSVSRSYSKDFKYTLQSKDGTILFQSVVTFGTEKEPFPKDWKEDTFAQIALQAYKKKFVNENFDILISEDLEFDI